MSNIFSEACCASKGCTISNWCICQKDANCSSSMFAPTLTLSGVTPFVPFIMTDSPLSVSTCVLVVMPTHATLAFSLPHSTSHVLPLVFNLS